MITEATTTQDLIATLAHARPLGEVSFEEGCVVLDAVEMFDRRVAGGQLGTWLEYTAAGRNALRFVPTADQWGDPTHRLQGKTVCEKLAQDVVTWTCRQLDGSGLKLGTLFTVWTVIDMATRVTWVECSAVRDQRPVHPRTIREASEFPSGSRGTVSAYAYVRMGETWHEVLDSVQEAYHEAKDLLDERVAIMNASASANAAPPDLRVTDGAVGIRTSQLTEPVRLRTLTVSGAGSVGIDLDNGGSK